MEKDKENSALATEEKTTKPTKGVPISESVYKIGHTTYIVRTFFNPNGTESLEQMVRRLIMKDIANLEQNNKFSGR